jgi:hypothetical protein
MSSSRLLSVAKSQEIAGHLDFLIVIRASIPERRTLVFTDTSIVVKDS